MVIGGSHRKNQIELAKYLKTIKFPNGQPKFDITALALTDVEDKIRAQFEEYEDGIRIVTLDYEEGTMMEDLKTKTDTSELIKIF